MPKLVAKLQCRGRAAIERIGTGWVSGDGFASFSVTRLSEPAPHRSDHPPTFRPLISECLPNGG